MSAVGDARKRQAEVAAAPGLAGYFVAPDAWEDETIWRERGNYPVPILNRLELRDDVDLWDALVAVVTGGDERADILAELAEVYAALNASTADITRLAAELHTAHGQIDRVRALADSLATPGSDHFAPIHASKILAALDGGNS